MYGNLIYANEPFAGGNQQPIQLWNIESRDSGAWDKQSFDSGFLMASDTEYFLDESGDFILTINMSDHSWTKVGHE